MQKLEITCDQCGSDLTATGNCVDYRIVLANESLPSLGGFVTSMMIYPPLEGTAHFCGTLCLAKWVVSKYPDAVAEYDKRAERRKARA